MTAKVELSVETVQVCAHVLSTCTLSVGTADFPETARALAAAWEEINAVLADGQEANV